MTRSCAPGAAVCLTQIVNIAAVVRLVEIVRMAASRGLQLVLALAFGGMLVGCNSGSSSSSSDTGVGGSQAPDPVVVDFPLAYIKRPLLLDEDGNLMTSEVRDATQFMPGAELLVRDRASPSAAERTLTEGIFPDDEDGNPPLYDVKDLSVSFDGQQLAFAMRAPEDPDLDDDEQPTWNIWLYDFTTDELRRVIQSDIVAEDGEDVGPTFLPDGRIVFSSTRQRIAKAVLLDEGKPQFSALDEDRDNEALTLHVMNIDGSEIQQTSFNVSSDLDPSVLSDGRVVFSRWDNVAGRDRISLYRANPDGTEQELLYGVHSHDTGPDGLNIEFVESLELPDGRLMIMMRPSGTQARMGALPVAIDVQNYVEHDQPTFINQGLLADAQEILISGDVTLDEDTPAIQGRYAHISPLYDGTNRLLVSWSQCRLVDTTSDPTNPVIVPCTEDNLADPVMIEADPLYGVWMYDIDEDTQQPIVLAAEGEGYSEVVVMENRLAPPVILDKTVGVDLDPDLVGESVGVIHIRNVYEFDGASLADLAVLSDPALTTDADRPARFVRIVKSVSIPDDDIVDLDGTAFGRSQAQLMRDIIGYAPIQPDGSVKVKVPANIPFWVELLDVNARRIGARHNNWMQVRPGEELECNGCHSAQSEFPHARRDAEAPSTNAGAVSDGSTFPNTEPALFANAGETMAEVITRINGVSDPDMNVRYDDLWTDDVNVRAKDPSFAYVYHADGVATPLTTPAPVAENCVDEWIAACRISIHYPDHIHPIWSVDRREFDTSGVLISDNTCTSCHNVVDDLGMPMVPMAQLDLSDGPSPDEADHLKSYRELLFNDNEQTLLDGTLQDVLVPVFDAQGNPEIVRDANGDPILDSLGNTIPAPPVPVTVLPPMSTNGANVFSDRFFTPFNPGGSHLDRLTPAELRLISEWIDIGGQYYNDPFAVPP